MTRPIIYHDKRHTQLREAQRRSRARKKAREKLDKAYERAQEFFLNELFFQEPRSWFYNNIARRGEPKEW